MSTQAPRKISIGSRDMSTSGWIPVWQRLAAAFDARFRDIHLRDVFRDTSYGFLVRVGGGGLAFGANWLLARLLGPSGVGIYYLAFTTITIAAVLSRLGLSETCVRYASPAVAAGEWAIVAGVRRTALLLVLAASSAVCVILLIAAPAISLYLFHQPALINTLRVIAFALIPFALLNIDAAMLQATGHVTAATVVQAAAIPGALFILLALMGISYATPTLAAGCYTLAVIIVFFGGNVFWRCAVRNAVIIVKRYESRRLLRTGLRIMGVNSISLVMAWTDTICLGIWWPSADVGRYGIAVRVALLTTIVISAVNSAAGPKFAELSAQNNVTALRKLTQRTSLGMTIVALPILVVLLVFPRFILGLFGSGFAGASVVLMILAGGQFIEVVTGAVGHLLMMSGHERSLRNILAISAVLNLTLNFIMVPLFGMIGAAVATAISLSLMNLMCIASVKKKLGIWPLPKW